MPATPLEPIDCGTGASKGRVLFVIGSLELGGAERHVVQVSIGLQERAWEPEVFVLAHGGALLSFLCDRGVPVHGVVPHAWIRLLKNERLRAYAGLLLAAFALLKTMWSRRPGAVHFFLPGAYIVGGIASFFARVPVRIMSRRSLRNYQEKHRFLTWVEHFLHPKMTLVCGNSQAVVEELKAEGVDSRRLRLIYNGVDLSPYNGPFDRHAVRAGLALPDNALVFVLVANLIPYKGHSDLIKALALIRDDLPERWVLLCVGRDDGIGAALQEEAQILGVSGHIRFLGSRNDVPDLLRSADAGILCSHQEGFSNALLEGMAAALPMVVSDVGGNAEAVVDGVTGYVVPARSPALLAEALLRVATMDERRAMGEKGRRRVETHFSMSACLDAYEALYRETGLG